MLPQYLDNPRYQGWKAADMHVHTSCSRDVPHLEQFSPEHLYRKGRAMGLDFIVFTDHDSVAAYDKIGWEREGLVTGCEFSVLDKRNVGHTIHVNVYGLDKRQFHELGDIAQKAGNILSFIQCCRENSLCYTYNHPFYFSPYERPNIEAVFETAPFFPAMEVNLHRIGLKNLDARLLAEVLGKGICAGSDTHFGEIGKAYTAAPGESFSEYFSNICSRNSEIVCADLTALAIFKEVQRFIRVTGGDGIDRRKLVRELVDRGTFEENPQMVQRCIDFITNPKNSDWIFNALFYSRALQLAVSGLYVALENTQIRMLMTSERKKKWGFAMAQGSTNRLSD